MKMQRMMVALLAVNATALAAVVLHVRSGDGRADPTVLRGQALELVDDRNQVRVRLNVEDNGEVVLRMLDQRGTIRVKLGAGVDGSGMVMLEDTTEPGIQLLAKPSGSSITLTGKDGQQTSLKP